MMGCITGFLSRVIFLGLWIFTPLVSRASDTWIVPLLGLLLAQGAGGLPEEQKEPTFPRESALPG